MGSLLIYSESRDAALELVAAGRGFAAELGLEVVAAALGGDTATVAADFAAHGAARVYTSADPALEGLPTDVVADALAQLAAQAGATVLLLGSTRRGRELAGRLAQKLGAGCVTDVNSLVLDEGRLVAGRYNLGGNTVQREVLETPVKVFAVMPKTFAAEAAPEGAPGAPSPAAGEVLDAALTLAPSRVKLVERRPKEGGAVNLEAALRIVGVGRGFGKREDLELGERLATAAGAELACTKSLADFGWLGEDRIVGLSGAKAKPDVYLAVGVSGQIQHTVGVSAAKVIAAVNSDKDAPIFALADYGVVGDLYEIVPLLIERLAAL